MRGIGILLIAAAVGGCALPSHIHQPENLARARRAQDQLKTLVKAEQEVLATTIANLERRVEHERVGLQLLGERAAASHSRLVLRLPWDEVRRNLGKDVETSSLLDNARTAIADINRRLNAEIPTVQLAGRLAAKDLATADAALKAAKDRWTTWNLRIATLEKLIEIAPGATALAGVKSFDQFKTTGTKLATDAGSVRVTYVDADGAARETTLKDSLATVIDDTRVSAGGNVDTERVAEALKAAIVPEAPGLLVTIAALGKEIAEIERMRVAAAVINLERRLAIARDAGITYDTAGQLLSQARGFVSNTACFPATPPGAQGESVGDGLRRLAADSQPCAPGTTVAKTFAQALVALENYVMAAGPLSARIEAASREDAYLRHVRSLEETRSAVAQREALVSRGIEGLALYHAGGLKPEQIGELVYRIAHLSIFGYVAGRL